MQRFAFFMLATLFCLVAGADVHADAGKVPQGWPTTIKQGDMVMVKTLPGTQAKVLGRTITANNDGVMVFGVGRDQKSTLPVTVTSFDGKKHPFTIQVTPRQWKVERVNGVARKHVSPPKAVQNRISNDAANVRKARKAERTQADFASGFARPVKGGRISGVFGSQRIFNGTPKSPHGGMDFALPTGTPIHAPADGIVTLVDDLYYSGHTVLIDHGQGINTSYLHMSKVSVKDGQTLKRGDKIGEIGATGRATGPHLHFGLNWYNVRLDPQEALKQWPVVESQKQ